MIKIKVSMRVNYHKEDPRKDTYTMRFNIHSAPDLWGRAGKPSKRLGPIVAHGTWTLEDSDYRAALFWKRTCQKYVDRVGFLPNIAAPIAEWGRH